MKVLILEDEVMLRDAVADYFRLRGDKVVSCHDGEEALQSLKKEQFDLILLDVNVPLLSGFDLLAMVREHDAMTPIIVTTAMCDAQDMTTGYELGCTDYIKKPFSLTELGLRVDQIFKLLSPQRLRRVILSAHYCFDQQEQRLYWDQEEQILTPKHRMILALLVSSLGRSVDLERFRRHVWERDDVDDATIRAEINRLKKILKEDLITNIKGIGYRLC